MSERLDCDDGIDNDGDGHIDCGDKTTELVSQCSEYVANCTTPLPGENCNIKDSTPCESVGKCSEIECLTLYDNE